MAIDIGTLNRRQLKALEALNFADTMGNQPLIQRRAIRKLRGTGGTPEELSALAAEHGDPENFLQRMAEHGPIAARRAGRLESQLGEIKYLDEGAAKAKTLAEENIGMGAASLQSRLQAALGPDAGMDSPAVQALVARYQESRDTDLTNAMTQIDMNTNYMKNAARSGGLSPQALIDTGDMVFAMEQLRKQESDLADVQRGQILGTLLPGPLGIGLGAATGGRRGAVGGVSGTMSMAQLVASIMGAAQGG